MYRKNLKVSLAALGAAAATALAGCSDDPRTTAPSPGPGPNGGSSTVMAPADRDTYVRASAPAASYGGEHVLRAGDGAEIYLRFDLGAIPEDAVVRSVTLCVTASASDGAPEVTVHEMTADDWSEAVTYDDRPESGEPLGSFSVPGPFGEPTSLTFLPNALATFCRTETLVGNRIVSLRMTSTGPVTFRAAEGNPGEVQPKLEVTYEMGTRVVLEPVADASVADGVDDPQGGRELLVVDRSGSRAFMRFDLASIPSSAEIHTTMLQATAYTGWAYGGDGNVYTYFVPDDSWEEMSVLWDNQPEVSGESLGHWWIWYGGSPVDQIGRNRSGALVDAVQQEVAGDRLISLRLHSPGYYTEYRSREYFFASHRPRLEVLFTR